MAQFISALSEGSIVKLKENGALVDFYVAKHNYESELNGNGRTLFLRAGLHSKRVWSTDDSKEYQESDIDAWLNNDYKRQFDPKIQEMMGVTKFRVYPAGFLERSIFLPAMGEIQDGYYSSLHKVGNLLPNYETYAAIGNQSKWTRDPYDCSDNDKAWTILANGNASDSRKIWDNYIVSMFTLPQNLIVLDSGEIATAPQPPSDIRVPNIVMQDNTLSVSWTKVDGTDSYVLERKTDSGNWTQVYSGTELSYTDTAGTWSVAQYRVKVGLSGIYSDYTTSAVVTVVPASTCSISGEDGDLGTLAGDIVYTAMTSTTEPITVTETVNGTMLRTFQPVSGAQQRVSVMDLPTGGGTAVIKAECYGVSVTRTWTYTKAAADFPAAGTPFDIAQLSKGGRVQFPQTLAECVRMPYGDTIGDYMKHWWRRTAVGTVYKYNVGTTLELHEYVQSNDRNAYPDSGISENYEYQYLGQPFGLDNLLGGAKIATGSYTGTGTYGASSPNSLTFEFEPKLLIIASAISGKQFTFVRDSTVAIQHNASTGSGNLAHSEYAPVVEWNGKTVTWYTTGNPDAQANENAKKYQYIAIG